MREVGIYVHIPFCVRKCKYCDFVSFADKFEYQEKYIDSVLKEIEDCDKNGFKVNTIYFGGGTPSSISSDLIVKVLSKIKKKFEVEENAEITIEVNPGTINKEKLEAYRKTGFNRISIGLQAAQNEILKTIGRIHTYEEFESCYKLAKEAGFENINVDLMLGLPKQSLEDLKDSLTKIISLNPNHISLYSLILEENTPLEKEINQGLYVLPSDEEERKMYDTTKKILEKNGYIHYEISNFAKKSFESKHNMNCWNQEEYLGFGLGAHSYFDKKRFSNTVDFNKYIENQKENVQINEVQTGEMEKKEYMMLGLRKINRSFNKRF